jgi:uncharacterized protein (DUF4415 family)
MSKGPNKAIKPRVESYDFSKGKRGPLFSQRGKTRITICIDTDILNAYREAAEREGRGYQTAMNEALRTAILRERVPLEERVRSVVREELAFLRVS